MQFQPKVGARLIADLGCDPDTSLLIHVHRFDQIRIAQRLTRIEDDIEHLVLENGSGNQSEGKSRRGINLYLYVTTVIDVHQNKFAGIAQFGHGHLDDFALVAILLVAFPKSFR